MASDRARSSTQFLSPTSSEHRTRSSSRTRIRRVAEKSRALFHKYISRSEPGPRGKEIYETGVDQPELEWAQLLDPFDHEPLSGPTCIRILAIKADAVYEAPVEVSVSEVDLDGEHAPYIALSHAWGSDPPLDRVLICDGRRQGITARIDYALRRVRSKMQCEEFRHWSNIWIDAVCIDQKDDVKAQVEKSKQVALMHRIFGSAIEVLVDLGRPGRLSHMLPTTPKELDSLRDPSMKIEGAVEQVFWGMTEIAFSNDESTERGKVVQNLAAVGKLFQREWFTRIWTLQEYVLARATNFLIGDRVLTGNYVENLLGVFITQMGDLTGFSLGAVGLLGLNTVNGIQKVQSVLAFQKQRAITPSWKYFLTTSCANGGLYEASDRRDFIYALHALSAVDNTTFPIDYTEPAAALSRRAARYILATQGNNLFLHASAGIRSDYSTIAVHHSSWGTELGSKIKFFSEDSRYVLAGLKLPYFASGTTSSSSWFELCDSTGHMDCVRGGAHVSDSIQAVSEPFLTTDIDDPKFPAIFKMKYNQQDCFIIHMQCILTWVERAVVNVVRTSPDHTQADWTSEILWRTFLHDRDVLSLKRLSADFAQKIAELLQLYSLTRSAYRELGYEPDGQPTYDEAIDHTAQWFQYNEFAEKFAGVDPEIVASSQQLFEQAERLIQKGVIFREFGWARMIERRICVTKKGRIGSVHHLSKAGDHIMIFGGCNMPFVTRKDGQQHRLVGSCYIDGIMYGEEIQESTQWTEVHLV